MNDICSITKYIDKVLESNCNDSYLNSEEKYIINLLKSKIKQVN